MHTEQTQHGFLVVWGWFAAHIGLLERLAAVPIKQKTRCHTPQSKILEALVATLAGLEHLQDISRAAHPMVKDAAVAHAWGQTAWADYSGVSRTLSRLTPEEAQSVADALAKVGQPVINAEVDLLRRQKGRICLDGDLTGLPVSGTARTYPGSAFGHMSDGIRLGYQAALVSMESPTYGRLWLSVRHHPGDTVSATQAEALVRAAEKRLGVHPRRRTQLLQPRLQQLDEQLSEVENRVSARRTALNQARTRVTETEQLIIARTQRVDKLAAQYRTLQRAERPTGKLAKARRQLATAQKRLSGRQQAVETAQTRLTKTRQRLENLQPERDRLARHLAQLEAENRANPHPVNAEFRLDAGFGTYQNLMMLIEMGYEVYTKPYSHRLVHSLHRQRPDDLIWQRVGANAEMGVSSQQPRGFPYPLDVALTRFRTGKTVKHSALLHYGEDNVSADLPQWFAHYNHRQTIEAGIKEGKGVFALHRFKVRAAPAIFLQEQFVIFAANFIRRAAQWLQQTMPERANTLPIQKMGVKRQVTVAAHTSARVVYSFRGRLLKFSKSSVFAGKEVRLPKARQRHKHRLKSYRFIHFLMKPLLIAQNLR